MFVYVCAVGEGVRDCWTATDKNKIVVVIVFFSSSCPFPSEEQCAVIFGYQALHHPHYAAAATD